MVLIKDERSASALGGDRRNVLIKVENVSQERISVINLKHYRINQCYSELKCLSLAGLFSMSVGRLGAYLSVDQLKGGGRLWPYSQTFYLAGSRTFVNYGCKKLYNIICLSLASFSTLV
jgi:hypothetical protein